MKPHARIISRPTKDGKVEIFTQDANTGKEQHTGLVTTRDRSAADIKHIKETLERSGSRVTVKEI